MTIINIVFYFLLYNILLINANTCRGTVASATFDLSKYITNTYIEVIDITSTTSAESNVSYYFDFCQDSDVSRRAPFCANTHDYDGTVNNWNAVAFRNDHVNNVCHRLSAPWSNATNVFSPFDGFNPAIGVLYSVRQGDKFCSRELVDGKCPNGYERRYQFGVTIRCADEFVPVPKESIIQEDMPGQYHLTFSSAAGCPITCPLKNNYICNGHGTCNYDSHAEKSRCFCNRGHSGEFCESVQKTVFTSSTTGFMIVTIVLVVIIIVFVAYIFYRLRKVNINPDSYESLENRFNQLGQMVN